MSIVPVTRTGLAVTRVDSIPAGEMATAAGSTFGQSADGRVGAILLAQVVSRNAVVTKRFPARTNGYRLWLVWSVQAGTVAGLWELDFRFDRIIPGTAVTSTTVFGPSTIAVDGLALSQIIRTPLVIVAPIDNELYNIRAVRTASGNETFTGTIAIHAIEAEAL
jgi:hypothetical protein